MVSSVRSYLRRVLGPLRCRSFPPVPQGRQTTLVPFEGAAPASAKPPHHPLSAEEMAVVATHWRMHLKHHPDLTWPRFLEILAYRERFFAQERAEREAKLATLQKHTP